MCYIVITFMTISSVWMTQNPTDDVNTGAGNGLVLSGNKPLPEPMMTNIYIANSPYGDTKSQLSWQPHLFSDMFLSNALMAYPMTCKLIKLAGVLRLTLTDKVSTCITAPDDLVTHRTRGWCQYKDAMLPA